MTFLLMLAAFLAANVVTYLVLNRLASERGHREVMRQARQLSEVFGGESRPAVNASASTSG